MRKILHKLTDQERLSGLFSLMLTLLFACIFRPNDQNPLKHFNRQIGISILNGFDANKTFTHFLVWYLGLPLFFLFLYFSFKKLFRLEVIKNKAWAILDPILAVGIANLVIKLMNPASEYKIDADVVTLLVIAIVLTITCLRFQWLDQDGLVTYVFGLLAFLLLFNLCFQHRSLSLLMIVSVCCSLFVVRLFYQSSIKSLLRVLFAAFPLLFAIFLEGRSILNQHEIFVHLSKALFLALSFGLIAILFLARKTSFISMLSNKLKEQEYPLLVVSLGILSVIPPMVIVSDMDLFESASHGMQIFDFFHSHKFPLIESFDGHIFSNSWSAYLYQFFNQDVLGAVLNPYFQFNAAVFLFFIYKLLTYYFSKLDSCLLTSFGFVSLGLVFDYHFFGLMIIFATIYLVKHTDKISAYFIYWLSVFLSFLFQVPVGLPFFVASVALVIFLCLKKAIKLNIFKIFSSFLIVLLPFVFTFVTVLNFNLARIKNRILEIIGIMNSNLNWAHEKIGDKIQFQYVFFYILLPLVVTIIGMQTFFTWKKPNIKDKNFAKQATLIILIISYFMNFTRILGRHSVMEMKVQFLVWTAILIVPLFMIRFFKNGWRPLIFMMSLLSICFFSMMQKNAVIFNKANVYQQGINFVKSEDIFSFKDKKELRWQFPPEMISELKTITTAIKKIIPPNKTYLDFTNQTLLYALTKREKPVFINQSPGMLSGKFTQKMFLKEIEESKNVDFVITHEAANIDGVDGKIRYYLVSEYINQKFMPLTMVDKYSIWLKKSAEKNYNLNKLKKTYHLSLGDISFGGSVPVEHLYDLKQLPLVWANLDQEKAVENKVLYNGDVKNNQVKFKHLPAKDKRLGNYLKLTVENNEIIPISVPLKLENKQKNNLITFKFEAKPGRNVYLIRVSSDPYWYTDDLDRLKMEIRNVKLKRMQVLQGD
ncbi:MAG: hypothetical protein LBS28_04230 [Streptococcaceae bacterium]|jgi:hypothetical protein|nr:hypothetical protein [Streptococcaceae bacterium]